MNICGAIPYPEDQYRKSDRDYIVRKGETEGEILIETDTGLRINRKSRTNQADYKSVKQNGAEVGSPETFLRDIFTTLQLNPIEFMEMDKKKQNTTILDMIEYDWDVNKIKEWFGEIPSWVSYDQNILQILDDIQSEKGEYFTHRHDVNRDIRNKKAFIDEIAQGIPAGYDVEKWKAASTSDLYHQIEQIRNDNQMIEKAQMLKDARDSKIRSFEADKQIAKSALDAEFSNRSHQIDQDILKLNNEIKALQTEKEGLAAQKQDKLELINQKYETNVAKYDAEVAEYAPYIDKEKKDVSDLVKDAEYMEKMKGHINEYNRMTDLQNEVEELSAESMDLTNKIEKARTLPGEILQNCNIPIEGLTVENGIPLINGLPVSNLSEGEKLDLCIDVSIQKPNGLQIILIDGTEKLSTGLREKLYRKCKEKGLQFIATRTTDDDAMTVVEL